MNDYVDGLKNENVTGEISIVAFSSNLYSTHRYLTLVEAESIANFKNLTPEVAAPMGGTPLYDASAHVMDLAIAKNSKRTVVIILTDGQENASKNYNQGQIKEKVTMLIGKGWEVLFLGANFDASQYSSAAGLDTTKLRNFDLMDDTARSKMVSTLSSTTSSYTRLGVAMNISDDVDNSVK